MKNRKNTSDSPYLRILVVCPYSHVGGAQIHTKNLFSSQSFLNVRVICPLGDSYELFKNSKIGDIRKSRFMKKYFRPEGKWNLFTILSIIFSSLLAIVEVGNQIKRFHPEDVYANGTFDALFCLLPCKLFQVPLIVTQQLIYRDCIDILAMRIVSRFSTKQVAISEAVLKNMSDVLPFRIFNKKCVKIFNAAKIPDIIENDSKIGPVVRIAMVSGILRWKGILEFIEAISEIKWKFPFSYAKSIFYIIGEPTKADKESQKYFQDLLALRGKLGLNGKVDFLGKMTDIESIYSCIDCCVNFSLDPEPFGLTVVEAMARKKIVLVAAHGGPEEIVTNGMDGFHVKPNSVEDLADKTAMIIEGINSKEFELIRNRARKTVIDRFNLTFQQKSYYNLFRSVL